MSEQWKTVPSLPQYEASTLGRIRHKVFVAEMPSGGHRKYGGKASYGTMRKDKGRFYIVYRGKNYAVHRLVCEAFNGVCPGRYPEFVCVHLNENALDNRPENLAWQSQKENMNAPKLKKRHRMRKGDKNPQAKKISDQAVLEIRASTETNVSLARKYGVAPCTVSNIRHGRSRANVSLGASA